LGGLEAAVVKLSEIGDWNKSFRLDSEYFAKSTRKYLKKIRTSNFSLISDVVERVQHPVEVVREYEDDGLLTIMAKNVRSNRVDLSDRKYMPEGLLKTVQNNKLEPGDVLMTRTGANYGVVAPWNSIVTAYACADVLVLRNPVVPTGFLSSYLSSKIGSNFVLRGGYGGAQPHVAPSYIVDLPVPRFSMIEPRIDALVSSASKCEVEALKKIGDAEFILLTGLGLANWKPPEPLSYAASSSDALASARLDAQFFAPRIRQLLDHLSSAGNSIASICTSRREKFSPQKHGDFDYIEISDLDGTGTTSSSHVAAEDAASRATWFVRPGDVITSTVRPIRRLSAQIMPDQDGYVCSSGFVVLNPTGVSSELLLTYLRLLVICELMDLYASASMYPAISETDLLALPFPAVDARTDSAVVLAVQDGRNARKRALGLLDAAKRAVEIAIEDSEAAAVAYLDKVGV
jgi:type I restriction enzyme, S subunit